MYPSSSSYDIDNSYVARNTRLYIPFDIQPFRRSIEHVSPLYSASLSLSPYLLRSEQRRCTCWHIYKKKKTRVPFSTLAASRDHRVTSSRFAFFLRFGVFAFPPLVLETRTAIVRNSCIFLLSESYLRYVSYDRFYIYLTYNFVVFRKPSLSSTNTYIISFNRTKSWRGSQRQRFSPVVIPDDDIPRFHLSIS